MHQVKKPCQEEWSTPTVQILQKSAFNANEKTKQNYYEWFLKITYTISEIYGKAWGVW